MDGKEKAEGMSEMVIVIDSREQTPFFKKPPKGLLITRDTLAQGDYSIRGYEHGVCVERKNPDDFLSSITSDSTRFKKRLSEMDSYQLAIIVVEKPLRDILNMCDPTATRRKRKVAGRVKLSATTNKRRIHPNVVTGTVWSIYGKYGIPIYFAMDRQDAENFTLGVLRKYYQRMNP